MTNKPNSQPNALPEEELQTMPSITRLLDRKKASPSGLTSTSASPGAPPPFQKELIFEKRSALSFEREMKAKRYTEKAGILFFLEYLSAFFKNIHGFQITEDQKQLHSFFTTNWKEGLKTASLVPENTPMLFECFQKKTFRVGTSSDMSPVEQTFLKLLRIPAGATLGIFPTRTKLFLACSQNPIQVPEAEIKRMEQFMRSLAW